MTGPIEELYGKLNTAAAQLEKDLGRPVSIREALLHVFESMRLEPSDIAWSWRINTKNRTKENRTDSQKRPAA